MTTFSIPEDLPSSEQPLQIDEWWKENTRTSWTWFLHSVAEHNSPVALEPGLPLAYEGENWTWEKKLASINVSSIEIVERLETQCDFCWTQIPLQTFWLVAVIGLSITTLYD
ncbi:MAG: hypothetical protein U0930_06235 [Pirellulales bacterium]